MNLILNTILQEKKRIERMLAIYNGKLAMLPKGSVCERKVGKSTYYYLKFREDDLKTNPKLVNNPEF